MLSEALRAGRHALGLASRTRWWKLARANVTATKTAGVSRDGSVLDARPKVLATDRAAGLLAQVGLVLTSLRAEPGRTVGTGPAMVEAAVAELATTLLHCEPLLRSGGYVAIVAHPRRRADGSVVDLTTLLIAAGVSAGLAPVERYIALAAELWGSRLVTRASLAERRAVARAHAAGTPTAVDEHLEVLVFHLAHGAELAAAEVVRPAGNGAENGSWRRAA